MAFAAKWAGTCKECGERWAVGELLKYDNENRIVHETCPDIEMPTSALGLPLCKKCWTYHNGECF